MGRIATKGLSVKEALDLDWKTISKMNKEQLSSVAKVLNRNVNYRVERLKATGKENYSQAYRKLERSMKRGSDVKLTTRGKTLQQMQQDVRRARDFLSMKTSTVKDLERIEKETLDRIGVTFVDKDSEKEFWEMYRRGEEMYGSALHNVDSTTIQKTMAEKWTEGKVHTQSGFMNSMRTQINKLYESGEYEEDDYIEAPETFWRI